MNKTKTLLRNFTASSEDRYLSKNLFDDHLVPMNKAKSFSNRVRAEKFLKDNPAFRNFRTETVLC